MNTPKFLLSLILILVGLLNSEVRATDSFEILEGRPLSEIEGLWSMTSEDLLVLILRNKSGRLEMTIAPENTGYGFTEGQTVGYLDPTAEKDAFWLLLEDVPASKKKPLKSVVGTYPFSKRCVLRLNNSEGILAIEKGDVSLTFNPLSLFPGLTRLIRLRFSNPDSRIREGFRKLAPGYDGGVASPSGPIYY